MKFGAIDRFLTGVAVPLSALRSEAGGGIGEFRDLAMLGRWCAQASLDLIQILPVNDTASQPSPYSARTAFALHPIYIHLPDVPGAEAYAEEIAEESHRWNVLERIAFEEVYHFKIRTLRRIFDGRQPELAKDPLVAAFALRDAWVRPYAAYCALKRRFDGRPWFEWPEYAEAGHDAVDRIWELEADECAFQVFLQYEADRQFREAVKQLEESGVRLKGDIPILIDEDSADVWYHRRYFERSLRAGAPPDMFSREGQNWGFPTYAWERLELDDYRWWRERLQHAERYYHAYRVDHVLGFFRIWQTPARDRSAMLGWFHPAAGLSDAEFRGQGLESGLLHELSQVAVSEAELEALDLPADVRERLFDRSDEGYRFRDGVGERAIEGQVPSVAGREALLRLYRDRLFVRDAKSGEYHPAWFLRESPRWTALDEAQREVIEALLVARDERNEALWAETGRRRLAFMAEATSMLVCAEDLGVVPDCVPDVLQELGMLGLRVDRWTHEPGDPSRLLAMESYPRASVATTSTHDTETLRGFWEAGNFDRETYYRDLLRGDGPAPSYLTTEVAALCIRRCLEASSLICILPLQDWFSLHYDLRTEAIEDERINVPGAARAHNWRWRTKDTLEFYLGYERFSRYIASFAEPRRQREL